MEKLGAAFGGGPSRKELQETVAEQKRQLLRYQARLQDVVRAYKSLLAEKEALEAGLKAALSARPPQPPGAPEGPCSSSEPSQDGLEPLGRQEEEEGSRPEAEEGGSERSGLSFGAGEEEEKEAGRGLRSQVSTLTAALATVAQEKSRMEASYQADKRQARQEAEEAARAGEQGLRAAQAQLAQTKARLLAQQHDRAQEQSDHALMLRELQRLLQAERGQREEAERGLEEARREARAGHASVAGRAEGSERQARQLRQELEGLRQELQAVRAESTEPDPELRAETERLRAHLQAQLLQEIRKTACAEDRVQMEEQRVARLEAQISEMSELLGKYERAKQKDQAALQKLRDRITQLDLENKTLAMAASNRSASLDLLAVEESHLDVNVLKDKMEMLRKLLRGAQKPIQEAEEEKKEADLGQTEVSEAADGEKATAAYYQQELKQLKEEFERYKLRAQVVLKNKSGKDGSMAKELEEAQEQLRELRENYVSLRLSCEELTTQHQEEMEAKKQEVTCLQQLHRQDLESCQLDYREKVFKLEEEMHKQRARALAVLAEKDQELDRLRGAALPYGLLGLKPCSGCSPGLDGSSRGQEGAGNGDSLESLTQALRLTVPGEHTFLLYTEQMARKEVEVSSLKKEKRRLEAQLHRLQERLLAEGEQHEEEVSALQSHLQKVGRDQKREEEGANLEYLKNIFYRFLTLADVLGRQQTLTAILTILHFSPEEKQAVFGHAGGGSHSWWQPGKR